MSERATWLLYKCLPPRTLVKLIQYQWETYGYKLELLKDAFREVEGLKEIDRLMREPSKRKRAGA